MQQNKDKLYKTIAPANTRPPRPLLPMTAVQKRALPPLQKRTLPALPLVNGTENQTSTSANRVHAPEGAQATNNSCRSSITNQRLEDQLNKICPRFRELEKVLGDPAKFPARNKKRKKEPEKYTEHAITDEDHEVINVIKEEAIKTRKLIQETANQDMLKLKLDLLMQKAKLFCWSEEKVEEMEKKIWSEYNEKKTG